MKRKILTILWLLLLCGCARQEQPQTLPIPTGELPMLPAQIGDVPAGVSVCLAPGDLFSNRDYRTDYDADEAVRITLNGSSITAGSGVTVSGSTATVTEEGTYVISGNLSDGMIIVDVSKKDKVQLVLSNASIHSKTCAPIYIRQADKVFITTAEGTENGLSNGGVFTAMDGNDIDAVIFSKEDLTLNGNGTLTVYSPAGHGIVSKDELTVTSGIYQITSGSHGMVGKDNVCMDGAVVSIASGKDGIRSNNEDDASQGFVYIKDGSFGLNCGGDGISASAYLQIDGGMYSILCGGGAANGEQHAAQHFGPGRPPVGGRPSTDTASDTASAKAIKAAGDLVINGGIFALDTADDAIHGDGDVTVTSGYFQISSGDDGIHATQALTVSGGKVDITASYEGMEGLSVTVSGGEHTMVCTDDGINAAGGTDGSGMGGFRPGGDRFGGGGNEDSFITVSGGSLYINAHGDGIDSNGYLTISGGHTVLCGPTQGDTAVLDFSISSKITGGTFIGTGSSMMAQTFSTVENQGVIALRVDHQIANTRITLADLQGNVLLDVTPQSAYELVILSCPEMKQGESYTVTVGTMSKIFQAS